eukprot:TRINITY_DN2913_c1_g3_i1.p2 TRINITY_DN2913_c1_g3~~TRINITY_DN2913_c1_g3_i1.p2  ORF type:complete len:219 (-),score=32.92 TRINITY_DN2913_c1_g3_i1:873-1529(-)
MSLIIVLYLLVTIGAIVSAQYNDASLVTNELFYDPISAAKSDEKFTTVIQILQMTGLDQVLQNPEFYGTVFLPTDEALNQVLKNLDLDLYKSADLAALETILTYHIIDQELLVDDLVEGMILGTLQGGRLVVHVDENQHQQQLSIEGVGSSGSIIDSDIVTGNSVMHVLDNVLLPFESRDFFAEAFRFADMINFDAWFQYITDFAMAYSDQYRNFSED